MAEKMNPRNYSAMINALNTFANKTGETTKELGTAAATAEGTIAANSSKASPTAMHFFKNALTMFAVLSLSIKFAIFQIITNPSCSVKK